MAKGVEEPLFGGPGPGFCMTLTDAAARDAYLPHAEHEVVKQNVLEILNGDLDGVVAFES